MLEKLLITHIKVYKANFFFIVSLTSGSVKYVKTAGNFGYVNIHKRSIDALTELLENGLKFLLKQNKEVFIKIEGGGRFKYVLVHI